MRKNYPFLLLMLVLTLASCVTPTPEPTTVAPTEEATEAATPAPTATLEPTPEPMSDTLYLAIIWHQHQPVYYKDPETGIYAKPWVRLHASKDYVDMAAMLEAYPDIHVTFNLTPSLLRQVQDFVEGARDAYWVHTEIPAEALTDEQKRFILRYFYDINPKIIARFPRYVELQAQRPADEAGVAAALSGEWTTADFRDLQVLFNLGWTDPDWLAQEPLAALVAKGRDFNEEDKLIVLGEHLRLIEEIVPVHQRLQETGQIEVTMTPFAHPILPLLVNTSLAKIAMPDVTLPDNPFRYGQDATAQLEKGVALYEDFFAVAPRGMWPAEGSVAQEIVGMVAEAGIQWMASDEGVLAASIDLDGFARDGADTVQRADALYRPYAAIAPNGDRVAMVFRDVVISDKVGFTYSGMAGAAAAEDFVNRITNIHEQLKGEGAPGPNLATVILDGENAWEHYDNDGKAFLNTLYQLLSENESIVTVTPSEYLEMFPEEPSREIDTLWPGSWISHDFATWIGEEEENRGWDYLLEVRDILKRYETGLETPPSDAALQEARDLMYIAEGSDWFWWYGTDQNSGDDESFDRQFRETLKQVLATLGETPPDWLSVPIIPQSPETAEQTATGLISPTVDGLVGENEWTAAAYFGATSGAMASGALPLTGLYYGFDAQHLYLRVNSPMAWGALTTCGGNPNCQSTVGFYFLPPGDRDARAFSRWGGPESYVGFGASKLLEVTLGNAAVLDGVALYGFDGDDWRATETDAVAAVQGQTLEIALPLAQLASKDGLDSGSRVQMRMVFSQGVVDAQSDQQLLPTNGPALVAVPDLGLTNEVLGFADPQGDDYGPGAYVYPGDGVFKPGVFDATAFSVGYDDENIVFKITLAGPLENSWGSGRGLSLQTIDVYIDQDGPENGARLLLPGRNAALTPEFAWDVALWAEGWEGGIYTPGEEGPAPAPGQLTIIADPGQSKITLKVPRSILGDDPENWSYAAVILSQDGYPSAGVWRVRDVEAVASQWRFGGAPDGTSHTRIIDLLWPVAGEQEIALGTYVVSDKLSGFDPDELAQIPMLAP
ncbi:MAG: glycoside hydrolase [Anaerolineae bacterium]|nr:glycoside hydrolase [Anaerolineae bacterium]